MKLFKSAIPLILAGIGVTAGPAWASPILITNFSFEAPVTNINGAACPIPGWTCNFNSNSNLMGVFVPGITQYPVGSNGLSGGLIVPDGTQAGYMQIGDARFSQDTAAVIADNSTYRLDVFVGHRNELGFPSPAGRIGLTHNGTGLPTATAIIIDPGPGQWLNEFITYTTTSGAGNPFAGQTLGIELVEGTASGQINFDNVRLDQARAAGPAVPEPSTWLLLGTGMAGLILWRRRTA